MFSFSAFIKKRKRLRRYEAMNRSIRKVNGNSLTQPAKVDHIITGNHDLIQHH